MISAIDLSQDERSLTRAVAPQVIGSVADAGRYHVRRMASFQRHVAPKLAVAIPARNEEALLVDCLRSIDIAIRRTGRPAVIVVLINGSTDYSFDVAEACLSATGHSAYVADVELAPAADHAGGARRVALDMAASLVPAESLLLTTDADSAADPDWIEVSARALEAGNDIVCGRVRAAVQEHEGLPASVRERARVEAKLKAAAVVLEDRLDPRPHNPGPRHGDVFGAALALKRDAYLAVGGLPNVAVGEDRALVERMFDEDRKVYFARDAVVRTSMRLSGRARGGVADALAARAADPDVPCDTTVVRAAEVARRSVLRRRLRELWQTGMDAAELASAIGVSGTPPTAERFGALSRWFEAALRPRRSAPMRPREFPYELQRYAALLRQLSERRQTDRVLRLSA